MQDDFNTWFANKAANLYAGQAQLDPDLVRSVIKQESAYNPNARSSAGAIGYMQLMPATAQGLGVDPKNPLQNIKGGVNYLKQNLDKFGNIDLALAAYNAGPGAVLKYGGVPPYRETQGYVKKVSSNYRGLKKQKAFDDWYQQKLKEIESKKQEKDEIKLSEETSSIYSKIAQFPRGTLKGIANVVGFPVDMVNSGLALLGISSDTPFMGSKMLKDTLLVKGLEPKTKSERMISRTSQAIGENLVGLLLPTLAGGRFASVIQKQAMTSAGLNSGFNKTISSKVLQFVNDLNKVFLANPQKALMIESAIATSGGVTAAQLEEIFPENRELAGAVGEIIGSLGPVATMKVAQGVKKGVGSLASLIPSETTVKKAVGDELIRSQSGLPTFDNKAIQAQKVAQDLGLDKTGAKFTYAEETMDPGLIAKERMMQRSSPEFAGRYKEHETLINEAIQQKKEAMLDEFGKVGAPEVKRPVEADLLRREGIESKRINVIGKELDTAKQKLQKQLDTSQDKLSKYISSLPQGQQAASGQKIRKILDDEIAVFTKKSEQLYNEIDTNELWDVRSLKDYATDTIQGKTKVEKLRKDIPESLEIITKEFNDEEPLKELVSLRSKLLDDIRKVKSGETPNRKLAFRLDELRANIDNMLDSPSMDVDPMNVEKLRVANQFYREGIEDLKSAASGRIIEKTPQGLPKLPDEDVVRQYLIADTKGGSKQALKQMKKAVGTGPEVQEAIRDYAISDALSFFNSDGTVNPKRAGIWLNQYRNVLDEFPKLKRELGSIKTLHDEALELSKDVTGKIADIEKRSANLYASRNQRLKSLSKNYKLLDYEEHNFVSKLLSGANPEKDIETLVKQIGDDKTAMNGLRRIVLEHIMDKSGRMRFDLNDISLINPNQLMKQLYSPKMKKVIEKVYTPQHVKDLDTIYEGAKILARSEKHPFPAGSDTMANVAEGLRSIIMRKFGRAVPMGGKFILAEKLVKMLSKWSVDAQVKLLENAMMNPELARDLIKFSQAKPITKAMDNRIMAHIYFQGEEDND